MIGKQINHSIAFLDVFISGIDNQNLTLQTYPESIHTGLFLTLLSYKISLVKFLIDRWLKICHKWNFFHNDIESIKSNLIKNAYSPFLINKVIKKHPNYMVSSNQNQLKDTSDVYYFKLLYMSNLSHHNK